MNYYDEFYHVSFCYFDEESLNQSIFSENCTKCLYLFDPECYYNFLELIPRSFTITTNNGSSNFNIEMLVDSSETISLYFPILERNEYNLDINDETNVLQKFERLYQGEIVHFTEEDLPVAKTIITMLKIGRIPKYLRDDNFNLPLYYEGEGEPFITGIFLDQYKFNLFISNKVAKLFSIKTKKKKYFCNSYGIYSSEVLKAILNENPGVDSYNYDYDDENGEFQLICDFFNFEKVQMTKSNIYNLLKFATDFKIEKIISKINKFIELEEKISTLIDEQQNMIDSINDLFDLLYHIKNKQISSVVGSIIHSFWSQTEENVLEMASFILQVINNKMTLHRYLIDLLIELNDQSNENNKLNILIPFIVRKLFQSFGESFENCSFVFLLYNKGIISKEFLINRLKKSQNQYLEDDFDLELHSDNSETRFENIMTWFMPEIYEIGLFDKIQKKIVNKLSSYILDFMPDRIDEYKKMRESGEPDDELTKSLRYDDIDTFKSIILKEQIDIQKGAIKFNIFDDISKDKGITYFVNYSAAYGSLKCFKYLYLNHAEIDDLTFKYAILGGNVEIIKIIDQKINIKPENDNENHKEKENLINIFIREGKNMEKFELIYPTIINHQYELFNWILENKFSTKELTSKLISIMTGYCIESGNIHSMIEFIDKGFNIDFKYTIEMTCKYGYYRMSQILLNISKKGSNPINDFDIRNAVFSDNLSIFKFCLGLSKQPNLLDKALYLSIKKESFNITKYIFDNLSDLKLKITKEVIHFCLNICVLYSSIDVFLYLFNKYDTKSDPDYISFLNYILKDACKYSQDDLIIFIIDLIFEDLSNYKINLTEAFINSAKLERKVICQYIIDKHVYISIDDICSKSGELSNINSEIFSLFYNMGSQFDKEKLCHFFLYKAIVRKNKSIVEFLLFEKVDHENALIKAVQSDDIEMVNLILKYDRKPLFINKRMKEGSALNIAVKNKNLAIVQHLLSIPEIDANIYDCNLQSPFMLATESLNFDIIIELIDFFGDNISMIQPQLNDLMTKIFEKIVKPKKRDSKMYDFFSKIIEIKSIDVNPYIQRYYFNNYLINADFSELIENLIIKRSDIDVNLCNLDNGDSLLMHFIKKKRIDIVEILIKNPKTNINHRNYSNSTALTIAVQENIDNIVDLLINDERFNPEESCLNYAFLISTDENVNKLYSINSLDVNYVHFLCKYMTAEKEIYESSLMNAVKNNDINKIDLIIKHSSFDKEKSCIQRAITISVKNFNIVIFRKLFKLINNDIKSYNDNNCTLVDLAIELQNADVLSEIIDDFEFNSDVFLNVFLDSFDIREQSYKMMLLLYDYDQDNDELIEFNELLPNGKSFFTLIHSNEKNSNNDFPNIEKIVDFLLQNGVDPNMPDKFDIYPLEHAINSKSIGFVSALLNSNKIDLSLRLKPNNTTFLHLAARSNFEIFQLILSKNVIDINSTDDDGETPLIEACRIREKSIITLLFRLDNLDYLHCNKEGKDAFKIIFIKSNEKLSKEKYYQRLISKL